MGTTDYSEGRFWEASEAASIHGASQAYAESVDHKVLGRFDDTVERDAAAAGLIAAGLTGMVCYLRDRKAWHLYDGVRWNRLATSRLIYATTGVGLLNCYLGVPAQVFDTGNLADAGTFQRRYDIQVQGYCGTLGTVYSDWTSMLITLDGTNITGVPGITTQHRSTTNGGTGGSTFQLNHTAYVTGVSRLKVYAEATVGGGAGATGGYVQNCTVRITDWGVVE
jgi:hypothetical protein